MTSSIVFIDLRNSNTDLSARWAIETNFCWISLLLMHVDKYLVCVLLFIMMWFSSCFVIHQILIIFLFHSSHFPYLSRCCLFSLHGKVTIQHNTTHSPCCYHSFHSSHFSCFLTLSWNCVSFLSVLSMSLIGKTQIWFWEGENEEVCFNQEYVVSSSFLLHHQ